MPHICVGKLCQHCWYNDLTPGLMLVYCQFYPKDRISIKYHMKFRYFHSWKSVWTCRLRNVGHSVKETWVKDIINLSICRKPSSNPSWGYMSTAFIIPSSGNDKSRQFIYMYICVHVCVCVYLLMIRTNNNFHYLWLSTMEPLMPLI